MIGKKSKLWQDLRSLPREAWILFAATLVNRAGSMVLPFFVLYLTQELAFPATTAGLMLFLYGAGALVAAPVAGWLADRHGPVPILRTSLLLSGAILLAFPLAKSVGAMVTATLLLAVATESFRPASMSLVGDLVPAPQRKTAFSVNRLAINLGMSVGPAAGGFLAAVSFRSIFWVDGGTSILAGSILVAAAFRAHHRPAELGIELPWYKDLLRSVFAIHADRRFLYLLAGIFPVTLVFFQHLSTMPLFLVRELGVPVKNYGLLFSLNTLLIVFLEVPLNSATSHWPHRTTLALGALLSGIGFGAMALTGNIWTVAATVVVWTFGEMLFFPAVAAYTTDIAPERRRGEYMGLSQMTFGLAFMLGPWAGTAILERFGGRTVWAATLLLGILAAVLLAKLPEPRHHKEPEPAMRVPDPAGPAEV